MIRSKSFHLAECDAFHVFVEPDKKSPGQAGAFLTSDLSKKAQIEILGAASGRQMLVSKVCA